MKIVGKFYARWSQNEECKDLLLADDCCLLEDTVIGYCYMRNYELTRCIGGNTNIPITIPECDAVMGL
jgi:hypothetical protein